MTHIVTIGGSKGGSGKSTTCLNLGAELARRGLRVLAVDLDPQASLTATFGVDAADNNLADVLGIAERGTGDITTIIQPVSDRFELAPGDILLSRTELGLVVRPAREYQLARALEPAADLYDFILIDAPPSLGMLTVNGLVAAQWVIVPTLLDALALRGLGIFIDTLAEIRRDYTQAATLMGALATMADLRTVHAREVLTVLRDRADLRLFETTIPRSIRFSEAALTRQAIADYEPDNPGAIAYAALADEVLVRVTT